MRPSRLRLNGKHKHQWKKWFGQERRRNLTRQINMSAKRLQKRRQPIRRNRLQKRRNQAVENQLLKRHWRKKFNLFRSLYPNNIGLIIKKAATMGFWFGLFIFLIIVGIIVGILIATNIISLGSSSSTNTDAQLTGVTASYFGLTGTQTGIENSVDSKTDTFYVPASTRGGRVDMEFTIPAAKTITSFKYYMKGGTTNDINQIDVFSSYPISVSTTNVALAITLAGFVQRFPATPGTAGYQTFTLTTPMSNVTKIGLSFYGVTASTIPHIVEVQLFGH
jgi:hypothetical protein